MTGEDILRVLSIVALFALAAVVVIWIVGRVEKRSPRPVRLSESTELRVCVVCEKAPATDGWPIVKQSKIDHDPSGHRRLHGQAPMFVLGVDPWKEPELCRAHGRMIERRWDHVFAEIRSRRSELEVEIEREVATLESGAMLAWARADSYTRRANGRDDAEARQ